MWRKRSYLPENQFYHSEDEEDDDDEEEEQEEEAETSDRVQTPTYYSHLRVRPSLYMSAAAIRAFLQEMETRPSYVASSLAFEQQEANALAAREEDEDDDW